MARRHTVTVAGAPRDPIEIECKRCGRYGRYRRSTVIARFGADASMPRVLEQLAACPRWLDYSDPCGAFFILAARRSIQ